MACSNSNLNTVPIPIGALTLIQDSAVTENLVSDVTVPAPLVCDSSDNILPVNVGNGTTGKLPVQSTSGGAASGSGGLRIARDLLLSSLEKESAPRQNGNSSLKDEATTTVEDATQATVAKPLSKKGPPPGLLPLPPSTPEGRTPRQAALRSAERIKVMAREDASNEDQENDIQILEDSTQASGKALLKIQPLNTNVIVRIITDPDMEFCKVCKKIACCAFKSKNEKNDTENSFCSKQCVLQFYPKQDSIKFLKNNNEVVTDLPDLDGTLQNIVIEPDIEIQTLSDDFQMDDGDEIIENTVNGGLTGNTTDEGVIEMAAKETFCCYSCKASLYHRKDALNWEAMEFCSEKCLRTYMKVIGSHCNMCNQQVSDNYLGKLCVRFGTVIRQFCSSECLDKFKGNNKLCGQCQVNMPEKDKMYCSKACEELARRLNNKSEFFGRKNCSVCSAVRPVQDEIYLNGQSHWLCSRPCRNAFCFVNKITSLDCGVCGRLFDAKATPRFALRDYSKSTATIAATWFCSNGCFSTHLLKLRKIECCARCQVKKYNVDMIRRKSTMNTGVGNVSTELELSVFFCSTNCYSYMLNPPKEDQRTLRKKTGEVGAPPVLKPIAPAPPPVRLVAALNKQVITAPTVVVPRSVVASMNLGNGNNTNGVRPTGPNLMQTPPIKTASPIGIQTLANAMLPIELQHKVVFVPAKPKIMKNKSVWCQPSNFSQQTNESTQMAQQNSFEMEQDNLMESITFENQMEVDNQSESTSTSTVGLEKKSDTALPAVTVDRLESTSSASQTESARPFYVPVMIPIPVPIYVPIPMAMYNCPAPFPLAFPIPLPIPTPVAYPIDPELMEKLMKAIAESKKDMELVPTDSDAADAEADIQESEHNPQQSITTAISDSSPPPPKDSTSSANNDEVDFEADLPSYVVRVPVGALRKRSNSTSHSPQTAKRIREADYSRSDGEEPADGRGAPSALDLKGAFRKDIGGLVWAKWMQKKKKSNSSLRLSDMGVMEVSTNLTSFVKELRKPDGSSYRPDVLLYFIYGLQLSFAADQRRENLLMEASLVPFQQELDKHLFPFYDNLVKGINADDLSTVSTCLKESHLWECRQLGCDSPIVLVFTMLYFNTKYFRLYTAEQHQQISFNTINKLSQKIVNNGGSPASTRSYSNSKAVYSLQLLHTVQQQNDLAAMHMKIKKPMDTPQNTDRPTECPIKHYNFYLTKCPESVRTRKDAFYMVPEASCTPDSPFWYSSQPLPHWMLARMLRRVLLIEEVLRNLCSSD